MKHSIGFYEACDIFKENLPEIKQSLTTNLEEKVKETDKQWPESPDWVSQGVREVAIQQVADQYQPAIKRLDTILANQLRPQHRRITALDIQRAKEYPVDQLLPTPVRRGFTTCPLHNERTASFHIKKNNTWTCYGCQQYGDSIDLYQRLNDATFTQAVKALN